MENSFIRVDDVAEELGVSKSYAYKIVQKLNAELQGAWITRVTMNQRSENLIMLATIRHQRIRFPLCYG